MSYEVDAGIYEGPLPLLVELIKLNLIDVFIIKLVALTQQYREMAKTSTADLNRLAEPLPLLGTLVAIKARGLLPQPAASPDEEEVPISLEELERRLKEYEQFKTVTQLLAELHALQHQRFTRPGLSAGSLDGDAASVETPSQAGAPVEIGLTDLMSAFAKVLDKAAVPTYEVTADPWTVELKITELRVLLAVRHQLTFLELFTPQQTKLELVVTFLALLELIRQRVARAVQEQAFSNILIVSLEATPS